MSQERWDVVLRFVEGPLSFQGEVVCRGPVVRMGANPGPGGLKLEGYRGLDDRQAVIQCYTGGSVSIAPVGTNQVRHAPHENVDWPEIPPIHGPVYLHPGSAFHLGPPGRGCTVVFVDCRRLGVWEQRQILSEAAQVDPEVLGSAVKELDTQRGWPPWFLPSMVMVGIAVVVALIVPVVRLLSPKVASLGPVDEGEEYYTFVDATEPLDPALAEGFNQPFNDFVMALNAEAADWPELKLTAQWDTRFLEYVTRSAAAHAKGWRFWQRLELIRDDYAFVVTALRDAGAPEVFAGIPYQESRYNSSANSPVCAKGWWQFLPEVAFRNNIQVVGCKLTGSQEKWSPSEPVPVVGVARNAVYVNAESGTCRIQSCDIDERTDLAKSTRGAINELAAAWNDAELRASGAAVQIAILSHNAGYDNARFDPKRKVGVLWNYRRYLQTRNLQRAPDFYGQNITCTDRAAAADDRCGGVLWKETQHYAYNIVAQHMLAVCYYAKNYGEIPAFDPWRPYDRGDGYCTRIQVPSTEEVKAREGGAR